MIHHFGGEWRGILELLGGMMSGNTAGGYCVDRIYDRESHLQLMVMTQLVDNYLGEGYIMEGVYHTLHVM